MFEDIINSVKGEEQKAVSLSQEDLRISVVGVGGAGCNCVNRIYSSGIKSAKTVAVNTDGKHLNMVSAHKKLLIGRTVTRGLGAGGDLSIAKKCAEIDRNEIARAVGENDIVFLCAGMGGGTGSGAAPIVAQIAKDQGAVVISMVTFPFALERVRIKKAQKAIKDLVKVSDTVVVIDNNKLVTYAPNLPINKAFELADSITTRAVRGIADTIAFPSLINVDYADVKAVMDNGGLALISLGQGKGRNKVEEAVEDTINHPLLEVDYEGAKGCLLHLEGGHDLTLGDAIKAGELITEQFDDNTGIKMGARINPELKDTLYITAIVTGVKSPNILSKEDAEDPEVVQRL